MLAARRRAGGFDEAPPREWDGRMSAGWLLFSRTALFAGCQLLLAAVLALAGRPAPFDEASRLWLATATVANALTLVLVSRALREEGTTLRSRLRFSRATWRGDAWRFALLFVVTGPVALLPPMLLSTWLFGDANGGSRLMFQPAPLPLLAVVALPFPVLHVLAELPLYVLVVLPRLEARVGRSLAVALTAGGLALQHAALPLLLDGRFVAWRALMYLPFSVLVVWTLGRRPTLLPWFIVLHFLMDAQLPVLTWLVTTGRMTM